MYFNLEQIQSKPQSSTGGLFKSRLSQRRRILLRDEFILSTGPLTASVRTLKYLINEHKKISNKRTLWKFEEKE